MIEPQANQASQFWHRPAGALAKQLGCGLDGLRANEAAEWLERFGQNSDAPPRIEGTMRAIPRRPSP